MAASTVAFLTAGLVASALPAFAITPDRTGTLTAATPFMWTGPAASGAVDPTDYAGTPCGKSFGDYCDVTLLNVDIPATFWDQRTGGVRVGLRPSLNPSSFFGLYVYRSDAAGLRGPQVAAAGPDFPTTLGVVIPNASGYYLVQVVYHLVTNDSYAAEASAFTRSRFPPRVDDPPGLQEHLASNVASGFRSHSEPHIAQSPTNPDILVAGSKFYNRDPDSLAEYNFKIGTMVSFDGGITWADLGQLAVCPPEQAPPSSWPNNSCYPDEDPTKGGNGSEDVDDPGVDDPYDPRGSGDVGEEYTTSDVWVQFDDEGNAYAMVLDAPNFAGGMGWGMTMHIWESVAPQDLLAGKTWGPRIPINKYDGASQIFLLDDKNTFAVNNAGPDGDGQTGIMVACWTQDVIVVFVPKQQIVCERSTDGGKTWPDAPLPISGIQPLTIGVDVRGDPISPNTFYAIWSNYVAGVVGAPEEMSTSRSIDGGLTWSPPLPAVAFEPIPRQFPGQEFRNLSIPILATGPNAKLYAVYAEYRPAPKPGDEDGMQADIMLISSTDGALTWSAPVKVNQDSTNADQFQPYVTITPGGQVNVAYFDRRNDPQVIDAGTVIHPGNFFIDLYLSRSDDGGTTFKDVRLSHASWDPSINPPISSSGAFIGDYQGLVADNCFAVAFFNDTHLANPLASDPGFDAGLARSEFQQVFAWRVPNTKAFAGSGDDCTNLGALGTPRPDRVLAATGETDRRPLGMALIAVALLTFLLLGNLSGRRPV